MSQMDNATIQSNLRFLIASASTELVHSALTQIMKEDYEFLQKFYAPSSLTASASSLTASATVAPVVKKTVVKKSSPPSTVAPAAPAAAAAEEAQDPPRIRADTKVRIVKKPTAPEDLPAPSSQEPAFVHAESGLRDPKEQKKWQKDQEDKKMQELRDSGVNPASLLTEANMRKWVVDEKKTFAAIAREYVGLSDAVIAAEAKKYGLQSDTSKRRAMIAANKARV